MVLRDRPYLFFLFAMLTNALIHVQSMAVLPIAVPDAGYKLIVYSAVFAVGAGIVVTCELAVTKKVQYWPAARAAVLGLVLLGVGLVGYGVGLRTAVPVLLLAAAVGVVGQIIGGPTIFAWPGKVAPAGAEGRYQGLALGMFGLGQALGPILGVTIYNHIGNNFWWLCGAGALVSAAAAGVGMRQRYLNQPTAVGALAEDEIEPAAGPALPIGGPEVDLDAVVHDKSTDPVRSRQGS
jgi:MFS family permease